MALAASVETSQPRPGHLRLGRRTVRQVGSTSCLADCAVDEPCEGDDEGDVVGDDLAKVQPSPTAGDLNGDLITDGQDLALVLAG